MENQHKIERVRSSEVGSTYHYRGVTIYYSKNSKRYAKWSYNVRHVAAPDWAATVSRNYEPFNHRARTKAEVVSDIDKMYEKGWLA